MSFLDDELGEIPQFELIRGGQPDAERSDEPQSDLWPSPQEPMAVARQIAQQYAYGVTTTLRWWRGSWMRWSPNCWVEAEDADIRSSVYGLLEDAEYADLAKRTIDQWKPNAYKVRNVLEALAAVQHLPEYNSSPSWLTKSDHSSHTLVACRNGLFCVEDRQIFPANPSFFNTVMVPFNYTPNPPSPTKWLTFLGELWEDDPQSIEALQEWFGYVLSGRTDLHKILLIVGPTRAGKGVIARVLAALVGSGNVAGPTLASMGTNFGLAPLVGKSVAVISDARLGGGNAPQIVERLLSVSGEDALTIDRKYKEPWTGTLNARFMVISNELPRFGDSSGAIANRMIILSLGRSFLGAENPRLTDDLKEELGGILVWALAGLDRLRDRGRFIEPRSSRDAVLALQDLASPVSAFVRDRCDVGGDQEVEKQALFTAWKEWCEDNGHRSGSATVFGRDLRSAVLGIGTSRPREGEERTRFYTGVSLK